MESLFAPPGESWQQISPRLRTLRRALLVVGVGLFGVVLVVVGGVLTDWRAAGGTAALMVLVLSMGWWLVGRNWASWGYAERGEDLLVTHGVMFKSLVVVPYGRMQFVDVAAGPIDRRFGIAKVQLHTATPATDAVIPGLTPVEAERLRDRLAALGEARAAGL